MRIADEIRIIDLLTRREAEFLRVKECEDAIAALLGGAAYPFPALAVPLPSQGPGRTKQKGWSLPVEKAGKKAPASQAVSEPTVKNSSIRPLRQPEENAYRLVYWDKESSRVSYHNDAGLLRTMLDLQCDGFRIECIETVHFVALDNFQIIERLWEAPSEKQS